ncbi:MAG: iron ABC transporter permease [Ileibacterium sp.]|nr:iron ABC transporter permease [Ileibacterium sp.]
MKTNRELKVLVILALSIVLISILSLCVGSAALDPAAWKEIFVPGSLYNNIVFGLRLPRLAGAVVCGGSLALSGAVMQSVLANPLAAPHSLGINAGAALAAALAGIVFPAASGISMTAALIGAVASSFGILALAKRFRLSRTTVILAGVAFSQIFSACTDLIITVFPDALLGYTAFRMGSLANMTWNQLAAGGIICLCAMSLVLLFSQELELLLLGHEQALSLGLNAPRWMRILLGLAALLAGGSVSIAGLIGFVGLAVPHLMKKFLPDFGRTYLCGCILGGALLLMVCDLAARTLASPQEIPVGILLALGGGPYFLWLLFGRSRRAGA